MKNLKEHFEEWHPEYDDSRRVVSVEDYREFVHKQAHDEKLFTNHAHVFGFVVKRKW